MWFNDLMTPDQVYLIRKSFAELSRHDHVAALVFYRRLFEIDPALRPLFVGDIEQQAKKLIDMLAALISMIERPVGLDMELRAMGARHLDYGVKDEHYATVGAALIDMLSEVLGGKFTPQMRESWLALYGAVEATMKRGAADAQCARSS
jgi:hemoglobin-like flavoprotein